MLKIFFKCKIVNFSLKSLTTKKLVANLNTNSKTERRFDSNVTIFMQFKKKHKKSFLIL